jgi:hypothetical protein
MEEPTITTTLIVPAQVIPRLREGANLQLAHAAYEIASSTLAVNKETPPLQDRHNMTQLWALLDAIGWTGAAAVGPVKLDLDEHSLALLIAVGEIEPHLQEWLAEMPDDDKRKPDRTRELQAVQQFADAACRAVQRIERTVPAGALAIPPVLTGRVREGAYALLAVAAEAIVRSAHAHTKPEPMSRPELERAWTLLARLGWTADKDTADAIELDIADYGTAVHAAIETMIPLLTESLDHLDPNHTTRPNHADELRLLRQFALRARQAITTQ